jgi:hypothetical protein
MFWVCLMLVKLAKRVADCQQRAAECRTPAERASVDDAKHVSLGLERRWMTLANSIDFEDRLGAFTREGHTPASWCWARHAQPCRASCVLALACRCV